MICGISKGKRSSAFFFLALGLSFLPNDLSAQLSVSPLGGSSPANLAASLVGPGVTVSNVTYKTATNTSGFFTGGASAIGFDQGIILSTGLATGVMGGSSNISADNKLGLGGDADIATLAGGGIITYDATALEFDFVPTDTTLYMEYVFASEEYNQWVAQYNDLFAFYLDGTNVATLPGGAYVGVNNVNACVNPSYFINNIYQSTGLCPSIPPVAHRVTSMNGLSKVMSVCQLVTPFTTHHMKLVVADVKDDWLDSNVFIKTGSLQAGGTPTMTYTPTVTFTPTVTHTPSPTKTPYPPIHVWPNPFDPTTAVRGTLKCENMRADSVLGIFTVSGEKVVELKEEGGVAEWIPVSKDGQPIAPGIYYYVARKDEEVFLKGVWIVRRKGAP